jgi:hypothetical protein
MIINVSEEMGDSRIVNNNLPIRNPTCKFQIGIFVEICNSVAAKPGAYPALGLVLEGRILDSEILDFGGAAAVLKIFGI